MRALILSSVITTMLLGAFSVLQVITGDALSAVVLELVLLITLAGWLAAPLVASRRI